MLTKAQLIDSVIQINPTARREWLGQFSAEEVRAYLDHLHFSLEPRGGDSTWRREQSLESTSFDADRWAA